MRDQNFQINVVETDVNENDEEENSSALIIRRLNYVRKSPTSQMMAPLSSYPVNKKAIKIKIEVKNCDKASVVNQDGVVGDAKDQPQGDSYIGDNKFAD